VLQLPGGARESIRWSEVHRISVITTDEGPRLSDVFFALENDRTRLLVPQDARGNEELVELLVSIEGFDLEAFARAMGSAENAELECWKGDTVTFGRHSP
jgi:hypothetical protein